MEWEWGKCVEPYQIYGDGVKILKFHRDKCITDLNPLFQNRFYWRDREFGGPEGYERFETRGNVTTYYFEMIDFFEAFMGGFNTEELADFFEEILVDTTLHSESLVSRIRNFCDDYNIGFFGDHSTYSRIVKLGAMNFPVEEMEKRIPASYFSKTKSPGARNGQTPCHIMKICGEKFFPAAKPIIGYRYPTIVKMLRKDPDFPIVFPHLRQAHDLDILTIIDRYKLPTDDLKIVKKD